MERNTPRREEGAMPTLEIVSLDEAQGQGRYVPDYIALIKQVPEGQAGKLVLADGENPITVRKWLVLAAKAMDLPLGIRRRGRMIYFWVESQHPTEQTTEPAQHPVDQEQPFIPPDEFSQEELVESHDEPVEYPELGQPEEERGI
jgi:hypothetical protein